MGLRPSIRSVLTSLCALAVVAASGCARNQETLELGKLELKENTTWSGTVIVGGDVYVPPGITLTITPGTVVKFKRIDEKSDQNLFLTDSPYYPEAELIVRGTLIARGTAEQPVTFTSNELNARPADWGAINFLGSTGNEIDHAKVLFAYNGVHAHGSQVRITNSEFAKNGVAVSFKSEEETPGVEWFGVRSDLVITNNRMFNNKGGIGFRNSEAVITRNEIRDNKFFGIWPKEQVQATVSDNDITGNKKGVYLFQVEGLTLTRNNIHDNTQYNIGPAEAQDFDLEAPDNWFGTTDRAKIDELIFDKNDDEELGAVRIDPVRKERVAWEKTQ